MPCCPLPASSPARPSSQTSCCEAPASSREAVLAAKENCGCNAICCAPVAAYVIPLPAVVLPIQLLWGHRYEREIFDLKMDMRV